MSTKRVGLLTAAAAITVAMASGMPAYAQPAASNKVTFPAGLKWEMMPMVSFGYRPKQYGTPKQRELAQQIWGDEINSLPLNKVLNDGSRYPGFVLLSAFENSAQRYYFTSFRAGGSIYEKCEDPPNSSAADTPMYSICPMKVVIEDKSSGQRSQQEFANYCHLYIDDADMPASKNHTEVAVDSRTNTAYFRVIQYGKHAPECDRAIRLK